MRELTLNEMDAVSGGDVLGLVKAAIVVWIIWETLGPVEDSPPVPRGDWRMASSEGLDAGG